MFFRSTFFYFELFTFECLEFERIHFKKLSSSYYDDKMILSVTSYKIKDIIFYEKNFKHKKDIYFNDGRQVTNLIK